MSSIDAGIEVIIHLNKIRICIFVVLEIRLDRVNMPRISIGVIRHQNKIRKQFL